MNGLIKLTGFVFFPKIRTHFHDDNGLKITCNTTVFHYRGDELFLLPFRNDYDCLDSSEETISHFKKALTDSVLFFCNNAENKDYDLDLYGPPITAIYIKQNDSKLNNI